MRKVVLSSLKLLLYSVSSCVSDLVSPAIFRHTVCNFRWIHQVWAATVTQPHTLSCSEGVLRLGLVRAVLVEGRACTCGMRVERSVCLSMIAATSQPIFFHIYCSLPEGFPEGFFLGTCSSSFVSRCRGPASIDSSVLNIGEEKMDPLVPSSSPY